MSTIALHDDTYTKLDFLLDEGLGRRAAIGLLVLATDSTIEHEWRGLLTQDGVAFYESRVFNSADISPESLMEMDGRIAAGVALLRPSERIDVVAFGCTSASMVIGEEKVFGRIREVRAGVACTTPITAALAALKSLGVKRAGLLTPYVRSINESMRGYMEQRGVAITRMASFEHANDNEVARIDANSLRQAVERLAQAPDVDAIFVSCTSLRIAGLIPEIEAQVGKPVISSNHAMAWHALRLAGVDDPEPHRGRLFALST
jgi:maleate isomerase